jgi:Rod binding domain-containing protein
MNIEPTSMPINPLTMGMDPSGPSKAADGTIQQEKLKKVARDFESVFVHQVMSVMKDTVPDDDQEDSSSEQIQGMYWSFMAQAVGEEGGIGMWKDLYSMMSRQQKAGSIEPETDGNPGLDERI